MLSTLVRPVRLHVFEFRVACAPKCFRNAHGPVPDCLKIPYDTVRPPIGIRARHGRVPQSPPAVPNACRHTSTHLLYGGCGTRHQVFGFVLLQLCVEYRTDVRAPRTCAIMLHPTVVRHVNISST